MMSLMRSSSVWLVLSTLAYQLSLDGLADKAGGFIADFLIEEIGLAEFQELKTGKKAGKKKPPGSGGFQGFVAFFQVTRNSLYRRKRLRTKSNQNKTKLNACEEM